MPVTKRRSDGATKGKQRLPSGIAYVVGRLRCGYGLLEVPVCRWLWANGTSVSNHTRRAMIRRNMVRCRDGRVELRPKDEWTEPGPEN